MALGSLFAVPSHCCITPVCFGCLWHDGPPNSWLRLFSQKSITLRQRRHRESRPGRIQAALRPAGRCGSPVPVLEPCLVASSSCIWLMLPLGPTSRYRHKVTHTENLSTHMKSSLQAQFCLLKTANNYPPEPQGFQVMFATSCIFALIDLSCCMVPAPADCCTEHVFLGGTSWPSPLQGLKVGVAFLSHPTR